MDAQLGTLDDFRAAVRRLARSVAAQHYHGGRGLLSADLEQEGMLAAWGALPRATCKTFVLTRARGAMLDAVRSWAGSRTAESESRIDANMLSADAIDVFELGSLEHNPEHLISTRQLFSAWFARMGRRDREIVTQLAEGRFQRDIAASIGMPEKRVSLVAIRARAELSELLT